MVKTENFDPPFDVVAEYQALVFEPEAKPNICWMPLASITWPDEHPSPSLQAMMKLQRPSYRAIILLLGVRAEIWRCGHVPAEHQAFWAEAQASIPNWPGFQRLSLSDEERAMNDEVLSQSCKFFVGLVEASDDAQIEESSDGVHYEISVDLESSPEASRSKLREIFKPLIPGE